MRLINAKSIILTAVVLSAALAQAHVEKGSFLNRRAVTVSQLVSQVEHDAQVRNRYVRHFQMSEDELVSFFSRLHVGKLARSGAYVVYNCHDDEVIRSRVFYLKAGTGMFMDETNKPILKISCGNPMTAPTPKVVMHRHVEKPRPPKEQAPVAAVAVAQANAVAPAAPAAVPPAAVTNNTTSSTSSVVTNNNSKSSSSLFVLPLLLLINTHSTHNSTRITTIVKKQPVPEPASMLVMGFGATALLIRRRKKISS